ncbi:hypothetical protein GGS23DRAFT_37095 [Durotheca rogersii]|uniref:uncharacterized protein n=1 Tax=Durotheca rogersii TaxID=419775 RepID=UPI0022212458|nr:uncharacterized protein GGS23DRAFT_37095 [Durotheca rogersii]KAI5868564.1 hypothetical protein GGS23DRAFT_37095 [Durotheca rogersii]
MPTRGLVSSVHIMQRPLNCRSRTGPRPSDLLSAVQICPQMGCRCAETLSCYTRGLCITTTALMWRSNWRCRESGPLLWAKYGCYGMVTAALAGSDRRLHAASISHNSPIRRNNRGTMSWPSPRALDSSPASLFPTVWPLDLRARVAGSSDTLEGGRKGGEPKGGRKIRPQHPTRAVRPSCHGTGTGKGCAWPHSRSPHFLLSPRPRSAELHPGSATIPGRFSPHRDNIVSHPSRPRHRCTPNHHIGRLCGSIGSGYSN